MYELGFYKHKQTNEIVELLDVDWKSWYCFIKEEGGEVFPIEEHKFFNQFTKIQQN